MCIRDRVWGFTAGVLSALLDLAGWAGPWPTQRIIELPPAPPTGGDPTAAGLPDTLGDGTRDAMPTVDGAVERSA